VLKSTQYASLNSCLEIKLESVAALTLQVSKKLCIRVQWFLHITWFLAFYVLQKYLWLFCVSQSGHMMTGWSILSLT